MLYLKVIFRFYFQNNLKMKITDIRPRTRIRQSVETVAAYVDPMIPKTPKIQNFYPNMTKSKRFHEVCV